MLKKKFVHSNSAGAGLKKGSKTPGKRDVEPNTVSIGKKHRRIGLGRVWFQMAGTEDEHRNIQTRNKMRFRHNS